MMVKIILKKCGILKIVINYNAFKYDVYDGSLYFIGRPFRN
jgi:hypothetical protein